MKTRKKNTTEPKRMLLLVCATEAETLYFSQMRKDCRYVNLTVLQAPDKCTDLQSLIDWTGRQRSKGRIDSAWALFGFDDVGADVAAVKEMEPIPGMTHTATLPYPADFGVQEAYESALRLASMQDYMRKMR